MARNTGATRAPQRQLDSFLGGERLPDHSNIEDFPRIMAVVEETLRWAPSLLIAAAHRLTGGDVRHGMFTSGGATTVGNIL
jgi:cytochrome P450